MSWTTTSGHPASGMRYEEDGEDARVTQDGREIVSPSGDTESVYQQYQGRVRRWLDAHGID